MAKRRAGTDLNRDNWDQEEEPEEVGCFEKASEDTLNRRVIKKAKRRVAGASGAPGEESSTKSLFSGFGGFTSTSSAPKSFSFLSNANTTNSNDSDGKKPSFSFLSNAKLTNNCASGDAVKPSFSFLSNSKLTNDSSSDKNNDLKFSIKPSGDSVGTPKLLFSIDDKPANNDKSASQSKLNELSKQLKKNDEKQTEASVAGDADEKNPDEIFLQKLRSLNLLCAEWIIKHLNENLSYILTPVFDDYKKYLEQLKEERRSKSTATVSTKKTEIHEPEPVPQSPPTSLPFQAPDFKKSLSKINFGGGGFFTKSPEKPDIEPAPLKFGAFEKKDKPMFEFGKTSTSSSTLQTSNPLLFNFGVNSAKSETKTENKAEPEKPNPLFGFGATNAGSQVKNTFFSANPTPSSTDKPSDEAENNDDQPPPKEDVSITEEGSVYDKKCKVFIKKDGSFVDHGVGFLFLKLVGEEKKCQVIVRANTKLANILINVLLSNVPLEKKGKNNVMMVCCPTPEAKPSVILLKVKTEEDADQLLEMMNKYKK